MGRALNLQVDESGLAVLTFDLPDKKVNVFTLEVLEEFRQLLDILAGRSDIEVLVLVSGKPGSFIAGFDVEEIAGVTDPAQAEEGSRVGHRLFNAWSRLPFPTVLAIQGTCLGGGTELALASTHIIISDRADIRIGLPEVRLGIIPAWGGCSRLPGRVGLAAALDIILAGKAIRPAKAYRIGLADALLPDAGFRHRVRELALRLVDGKGPSRRGRGLKEQLLDGNPVGRSVVFRQARQKVLEKTGGHYPAPLRAVEVVEVAVRRGLEAGLEAEARATGELAVSAVSKNLMHVFRLMEASKNRTLETEPRRWRSVGVLGAGVMGGGIAQQIASRLDLPVRLKDLSPEPLAGGLAHAATLFETQVRRRRLTRATAQRQMNLLRPTLDYTGFQRADLVIEAIVENLEVKQRVFAELEEVVGEQTILASNTSSLSIDLIAQQTRRPQRVVGMHFFNPVHRMPLVEIIRGSATEDEVVETVYDACRRLGKTPVVVGNGPGFLVNRLLGFYMTEALWLLHDGFAIEQIDAAMTGFGMPMGPLALIDEVGLDVAVEVAEILAGAFGQRLLLPPWVTELAAIDRLGVKSGGGIYDYADGRRGQPYAEIYALLGLAPPQRGADDNDLVDRLVLRMVDEAARCLEEGIARSAGDIDLAMIMGTGFPPFRGGLCRWADAQGVQETVAVLQQLAQQVGERFEPSAALLATAAAGGFQARFGAN